MIRHGKKLRFTRSEIAEFRELGFELAGVKTLADWEEVLTFWADTLAAERPELLEKIVRAMERVQGMDEAPPHADSPNPP